MTGAAAPCTGSSLRQAVVRCLRYFHPTEHVWFRPVAAPASTEPVEVRHLLELEMGLTQRGLEDVGDVTAMKSMVVSSNHRHPSVVSQHDDLAIIEWEGFTRSSSDELYHAQWGTFSGETRLKAPINAIIKEINVVPNTFLIEEDTILATLEVETEDWEEQIRHKHVVGEFDYQQIVKNSGPGRFSDEF